mgnify:CR=1 FL=1
MLFDNIGRKIKCIAKFLVAVFIIVGIVVAIVGIYTLLTKETGGWMVVHGLIIGGVGTLSTLPLYGFGELIENVDYIAYKIKEDAEEE